MLYKPTLLEVNGFDADTEKIFNFTVPSGGDSPNKNKLIIYTYTSDDKIEVYNEVQTRYNYNHVLPIKTLSNGVCYLATVTTIRDIPGQPYEESKPSAPIEFCCYQKPILQLTNIPEDNIIKTGSFRFDFVYAQIEGDKIESYVMNLYNESGVVVASSGRVYAKQEENIYHGNYIFNGLEDGATYDLELITQSKSGIVTTLKVKNIKVKYKNPNIFALLKLDNNCDGGYITITSNLVPVAGETYPKNPNFIDNKEIDLTKQNYYAKWNSGYNVSDDFLVRAWFRKPNSNREIVQFSSLRGEIIKIEYMEGYEDVNSQSMKSYIQVTVSSINGMEYYIFSNYIDTLLDTEYYNMQLKRENNVYQVQLNKTQ